MYDTLCEALYDREYDTLNGSKCAKKCGQKTLKRCPFKEEYKLRIYFLNIRLILIKLAHYNIIEDPTKTPFTLKF